MRSQAQRPRDDDENRKAAQPSADAAPHVALAGSRAWLALGNKKMEAGRVDEAIACARNGLAELGSDYAGDDVNDDTGLKLHAADELVQTGQAANGARLMLRMLGLRHTLYQDKHRDIVAH